MFFLKSSSFVLACGSQLFPPTPAWGSWGYWGGRLPRLQQNPHGSPWISHPRVSVWGLCEPRFQKTWFSRSERIQEIRRHGLSAFFDLQKVTPQDLCNHQAKSIFNSTQLSSIQPGKINLGISHLIYPPPAAGLTQLSQRGSRCARGRSERSLGGKGCGSCGLRRSTAFGGREAASLWAL